MNQEEEFYVCPNHCHTGGWESCCSCGDDKHEEEGYNGRLCTEEIENQNKFKPNE